MVDLNYPRGLNKLGDHTYAWMLPDGSWGWSNSGLVVGEGQSLLFDTHYDLNLTREMLNGVAEVTAAAPITRLVNSHGNGDHFYGNELLGDEVEIFATVGTNEMMSEDNPQMLSQVKKMEGFVGDFVRDNFGAFDFDPIDKRLADTTFEGELELNVGGVDVVVKDLGPAHTRSDAILWVPSDRVVYAADLLFVGGTPIAWDGPLENWIAALDYIVSLDAKVVVPGHGPISGNAEVLEMRGYFEYVIEGATKSFNEGIPPVEAARNFDLGKYGELNEHGRVVQNFLNVYHHLGKPSNLNLLEVVTEVARIEGYGD